MIDQKEYEGHADDHIIKNVLQHKPQEQHEHENALLIEIKNQMFSIREVSSYEYQTTEQSEHRKEKEYEEREFWAAGTSQN
jgi:hypothetical protein